MSCDWDEVVIKDVIEFNPKESLKKGQLAKKIAMDELQPFTKKISGFAKECFTGGAKFRNGDTLLARITPCLENGKTAFVDILDQDEIAFGSTEFIVMRAKPGKTDSKFVYYLATSPNFRSLAIQSMTGTSGRQRVQNGLVENAVICIPPLDEQFSIAETLSCLDDKIELNNRINKTLEEMAQAIFKQWFVDFDFPNENGQPYKSSGGEMEESELGPIPKGWKILTYSEFISPRKEKVGERDIPEYSTTNTGIQPRSEKFKKQLSASKSTNKVVYKNDLVFGMSRQILNWGVMSDKWGAVSSAYDVFEVDQQKVSSKFLKLFMSARINYFMDIIKPAAREGQGIDKSVLLKKAIYIPNRLVWDNFYVTYKRIQELVQLKVDETETLTKIRDTLLPKLMSGEIRVPIEEVPESV